VAKLVKACRDHNKTPGFLVGNAASGKDWLTKGFRCLCYGTDVIVFREALADGIAALRKK